MTKDWSRYFKSCRDYFGQQALKNSKLLIYSIDKNLQFFKVQNPNISKTFL